MSDSLRKESYNPTKTAETSQTSAYSEILSPNRKKHNADHARPKFLWDKDYRAVTPEPWGIRKSDGFEVLQIITNQSMSRLEKRSEELNLNSCAS